ncbi:unnamed protein product [Heligmosomoides polygyrus]|uniref:HTH_48 domain-containing protein n=1 Tax=Heligmosomoides polygyrus TaxID=6339 RepID=A0A183G881_HELPZ|nr:unnamed protein product [Heligmosomoides polygyrus]
MSLTDPEFSSTVTVYRWFDRFAKGDFSPTMLLDPDVLNRDVQWSSSRLFKLIWLSLYEIWRDRRALLNIPSMISPLDPVLWRRALIPYLTI